MAVHWRSVDLNKRERDENPRWGGMGSKNSGGIWDWLEPRDTVMASPYERMLSFNYQWLELKSRNLDNNPV